MLQNIPVEKILRTATSNGADMAELYAESARTTAISNEDKKNDRVVTGVDKGYGIRVVFGDKTYYGFTSDPLEVSNVVASLTKGQEGGLSLRAAAGGEAISRDELNLGDCHVALRAPRNDTLDVFRNALDAVERASVTAWKLSPLLKQVQVSLRSTNKRTWIVNSSGIETQEERNDLIMVVLVVASKNGDVQTGYEPAGGSCGIELFERVRPEDISKNAVERALTMLKARHAPRGQMPVVISSSAGGTLIHEAVGHGLEADLVTQGMSIYKDKLGQQVASKLVTVVDDATLKDLRGTFKFDDEGTPSERTVLIENGVLKCYMQNKSTAKRMRTSITGNCRRESFRHRPIVRMTNTFIVPNKDDPDAIVRSVAKGLFVKKMGGGQVNTINGDFVFEAQEAYLIENGQIGEPVRGATLIGNGPKVLMDIDMVGTDLGFGIGTCGKEGQGVPVGHGMPTIRIPELTVGGTM